MPKQQVKSSPDPNAAQRKRYSWVDIPAELRRPDLAMPDEQVPQLPTVYDQSTQANVISPEMQAAALPEQPGGAFLGTPDVKTSPYDLPPPHREHPALSAPYDQDRVQNSSSPTQPRVPQFPLPNQHHGSVITAEHDNRRSSTSKDQHGLGENSPVVQNPPFRAATQPIYQPDALTGPDGLVLESHTPGQVGHPIQQLSSGHWKHGLGDCSDFGACCTGLICPCVLYGKTQYRLTQRAEKQDPTNMLGYKTTNGSCFTLAICCPLSCMLRSVF